MISNQFAAALYSILLCCFDKQCDKKQHMRELVFAHNSWGIPILDGGENMGRKWPEQGDERVHLQLQPQSRGNEPELEQSDQISKSVQRWYTSSSKTLIHTGSITIPVSTTHWGPNISIPHLFLQLPQSSTYALSCLGSYVYWHKLALLWLNTVQIFKSTFN